MFGKKKNKNNEQEKAVSLEEAMENIEETASDDEIETELSIPEDWNIKTEERYVYAFHNSESPKLKLNQISIYKVEVTQLTNKGFSVSALIRSTVQKPIQFGNTTILLLDAEQKPIARKEFDLSKLGTLPPNSARPFVFSFMPQDLIKKVNLVDEEDWSLAFELKKKHQLDLPDSWKNAIDDKTKASLEKIVSNAAPLKPGEVNFMGINAKQKENKDLVVTLLIRNGSDKNVTFQQIPLAVKDASNEVVAKGSFKLDNFEVKSNTSKPWTFIFPASMLEKEELDLSRWQAFPINN